MLQTWLATATRRFFPSSPAEATRSLELDAARGERVAFQAVFRTGEQPREVSAEVTSPLPATVRQVGYVPVPHLTSGVPADDLDGLAHLPGPAPDPLLDSMAVDAGAFETHSFWISLTVPVDIEPGAYPVTVKLGEAELTAVVHAHRPVLASRRGFPVTNWLYADALCDHYGVDPFSDGFWRILRPYLANYTAHGPDTMYVPMITPTLDGVKRPTQLLGVRRDGQNYRFDWTPVRRWITECRAHGVTGFEWAHLFTQWGAAHAPRVYDEHGPLWPDRTGATSVEYAGFLAQLLPELERFLAVEDLGEHSYFHLSDEPEGEDALANYRAARALLRGLAPNLRVMDALSDLRFAEEGLVDVPIPLVEHAMDFLRVGHPAWVYYCTVTRGRHVNQAMDTPLAKLRMLGWLLHRTGARGFLHWGYNYWYRHLTPELIDPFQVTDAGGLLPTGDGFCVYPGPDGPIDSMRWEIYAHALQDLALLRQSGIASDDPLLADIHDFADFPRTGDWLATARRTLLARAAHNG